MLSLHLDGGDKACKRVLCIGAHSDDIEIGCGGAILRLVAEHPDWEFSWVVLSGAGKRLREARKSAAFFLKGARNNTVVVKQFRTSFFPYTGDEIKAYFETLKAFSPDVVFTHYRNDLHQDHRVVADLTWNTFRSHFILEYEIPKYDGDLGTPNCFVHLDEKISHAKTQALMKHFKTQNDKHWFTEDTFLGLMRLRGVESAAPGKFAEAFYSRKVVLS